MVRHFDLQEVTYSAPPGISCRYYIPNPSLTNKFVILIVSFSGVYPDGSAGNRHADYMSACAIYGLQAWRPDCLMVDIRNLQYYWGDAMLEVLGNSGQFMDRGNDADGPLFPQYVVSSEKSAGARTLFGDPDTSEHKWHLTDIDAAIEGAVAILNANYP